VEWTVLHISVKSGMNGIINLKLLLDTNIIIDFLKQHSAAFDLTSLFLQHECFTSVIVKLELLRHPDITPDEEKNVLEFLRLVPIMSLNESIENETITLSRSSKLKLPDAIIGATAIVYSAELVTRDSHFLDCQYKKLQIWRG